MRNERHQLVIEGAVILALSMAMAVGCSSKKKVADSDATLTRGVASTETTSRELTEPPVDAREVPMAHFEFDSAALSSEAVHVVNEQSRFLRENPEHTVVIVGAADERGSEDYNYRLGLRRAASVRNQLVRDGVSSSRIQIRSVGESEPMSDGHDEASWALNRRAEVHISAPDRMALK